MAITLNEHKVKHIDQESLLLIDLLETSTLMPDDPVADDPKKEKLIDPPPILTFTMPDNYILTKGNLPFDCFKRTCIGFNEENYIRFKKLVDTIHKGHEVGTKISHEFVHKTVWGWLIQAKRKGQSDGSLSDYLHEQLNGAIKEYKMHFTILYLHPKYKFNIGLAEFGSFSGEYFDKFIDTFNKNKPGLPNVFVRMKKEYFGQKYVAVTVEGEKIRAQQIAADYCAIAVDILKICSDTLDQPDLKISFDIDFRSQESPQDKTLVEAINSEDGLTTQLRRKPANYDLEERRMAAIEKRGLNTFRDFLISIEQEKPSELQNLILRAIRRFADALTNTDLHRRVASLFTILESLLLLDQDSPITDSVVKYTTRLVSKDIETRKILSVLIKELYKVRSKWVHHAIEEPIHEKDLAGLQIVVHTLLKVLIGKTKQHKEKATILKEIDDAILSAG
ncbi:MAG TPA: hypothetical protein VK658_08740 [Chryseolinea sp.]|nr:hypothetical protein [Chryseolinea sp.]